MTISLEFVDQPVIHDCKHEYIELYSDITDNGNTGRHVSLIIYYHIIIVYYSSNCANCTERYI